VSTPEDRFYEGLMDAQTALCKAFADELARIRRENLSLKSIIATFPSDLTDMQDRLELAHQQIQSLRITIDNAVNKP